MTEKTAVVTKQAGVPPPATDCEEEVLVAALAAALVRYKKCVGDQGCRQAQAAGTQWRTLGRWEQLAAARRA